MAYQNILFDLDGTISDSGLGITNAVKYALNKFGIEENDRAKLNRFVGPPLSDSFQEYYGFTPEKADLAIKYYREYYTDKGLFENVVYPGVEELLQQLCRMGKKCIVATSKPEKFSKIILEHFGLARYFTMIAGADMDGARVRKADVIQYALQSCEITDLNHTVMVGDREHDIFGAQQNGLESIGVLYGYGDQSELEKAGATFIARTPGDILNLT